MTLSTLTLKRRRRRAEDYGGATRRGVDFLDFVVDDVSLFDSLCSRGHDLVSCLGWLGETEDFDARARLLIQAPGDLPSGRVSLYVCPECGDLGCGAITVDVRMSGGRYCWHGLGYENNYEPGWTPVAALGPFSFDAAEYRRVLGAGRV